MPCAHKYVFALPHTHTHTRVVPSTFGSFNLAGAKATVSLFMQQQQQQQQQSIGNTYRAAIIHPVLGQV